MTGEDLFADRLVEVWAEPGRVGTGVAIGERGILTARHIVEGALTSDAIQARIVPTGAVEVRTPVWVHADCVWEQQDSHWDIALLKVRDDTGWIEPRSKTPVVVALDSRPEPHCQAVGFPTVDVQTDSEGKPLRQTTSVIGRLLPSGQARAPVTPGRVLPARWLVLDIDTATPLHSDEWAGMSGAPVVLADGRLAAIVVEASGQSRQLFVVSVNDVLTHADGFRAQFDHLAGTATVVESRDAARYRAALMIETLDGSRRPRRVNQQKSLAVFGVKPAAADENGGFLTYVMRDADFSGPAPDSGTSPGLRDVLRAVGGETGDGEDRRVVLIEGSTAAGKSRSAAEAAIVELATRWLLRPIPGAQALRLIREWPSAELSEALIWLDDVEMYAEPGLGESFRRLLATGAVVIATIRTEQLKVITDTGDLQNPAALALNDPSAVRQLHWNKSWSQTERLAVQEVLETENARQAVADGTPLGVWAVAGLQLSAKYERIQHDDDHPEQKAMVRAILDWYRTGHTGGMPRIILTDLLADGANGYGDATGGFPAREIDVAVEELARPLLGSVREGNALLTRDGSGELLGIHDYIRDADATKVRDIPRSMWLAAAAHASDPNVGHEVAIAARQAGMLDIARAQLETIAQQGDPGAQSNLGVVLHELGDDTSARAWFRKSAEAGDSNGQYNFAVLLENEDEIAEAEAWYRKAAEAGIDSAQYNLGRMLVERRDLREGEEWLRLAATAGVAGAQYDLGVVLQGRGEVDDAEGWYRKAAQAEYPSALNNLAAIHYERGDKPAAETLFREAAAAGETLAMRNLGALLDGRGQTDEAEIWWRRAADADDTDAQYHLGTLLDNRGDTDEAELWWRRAADTGNAEAQNALGLMYEIRDDAEAAEIWYRKAVEAGHPKAQTSLGAICLLRGDLTEARTWWRKAAAAGDSGAANNLELFKGLLVTKKRNSKKS